MSIFSSPPSQYAKPAVVRSVGVLSLPNSTSYTGDILGDMPNGWGILTETNGSQIEGEWRLGNPYTASGRMVYPDGTVEDGQWDYRLRAGYGTIRWPDGTVYKGTWRNIPDAPDRPDGNGTMTWPDGRTYVGHFFDGVMDGMGRMTYPDGKTVEGRWIQGKPLQPSIRQ